MNCHGYSCYNILNQLDTLGSTLSRNPQARSSALAALGTLQPQAFGSLNRVDHLDSVSIIYRIFLSNCLALQHSLKRRLTIERVPMQNFN